MSNKKQREKALKDLGMYFAEKGKVLSQKEYIDAPDKPILFSGLRRVFRSYSRMTEMLKRNQPDLFKLATKEEKPAPKVEVKKPTFKKPEVKASVKPVSTGVKES